ncbi:MAG: response regulator [Bacteroidales bacterium]|nr:response regulator [Bacteroidales bacterium]
MSFSAKMFEYLSFGAGNNSEKNLKFSFTITNIFTVLAGFFLLLFDIFSIIAHNYFHALVVTITLALLLVNFFMLHRTRNYKLSNRFLMGLTTIVYTYFIISGGVDKSYGYLWVFSYPVISMFLFGTRKGTILALGFMAIMAVAIFIPIPFTRIEYPFPIAVRIFSIYFFILVLTFAYLYLSEQIFQDVKHNAQEAQTEARNKDEFLSKLSHQIRTPLNNIMALSEYLSDTKLDENQKDLVESLIASTNNLVNVVNSIVKVSLPGIEDKTTQVNFELISTLRSVVRIFEQQHPNDVLHISLVVEQKLQQLNVVGDPIRLKQIFLNLIDNVLKFRRSSGNKVNLSLQVLKENFSQVEISFEISFNYDLPSINLTEERWLLSDNMLTTLNIINSNFDILIAKRLIELAGSRIFASKSNGMTVLEFSFKFKKAETNIRPVNLPKTTPSIAATKTQVKIDLKDANVLLVEDNLINQKIVLLSLKPIVSNIDVANNGKEALDLFVNKKYDIILMDIQMPVMDGLTATKKIRELEASTNTHVPIIAITANALAGDKEICLAAGMNEYISKPFQIETLIQKMKELLEVDE